MTSTTAPETASAATPVTRVPFRAVLRTNLIAFAIAAAATEALTAVVRAAGVHLAVGDPGGSAASVVPLNPGACAISLAMVLIPGIGLAAAANRRASRAARTYTITAALLAAISLAAPLTAGATSGATKLTLTAAHLIAAAVIIPMVARRLTSNP